MVAQVRCVASYLNEQPNPRSRSKAGSRRAAAARTLERASGNTPKPREGRHAYIARGGADWSPHYAMLHGPACLPSLRLHCPEGYWGEEYASLPIPSAGTGAKTAGEARARSAARVEAGSPTQGRDDPTISPTAKRPKVLGTEHKAHPGTTDPMAIHSPACHGAQRSSDPDPNSDLSGPALVSPLAGILKQDINRKDDADRGGQTRKRVTWADLPESKGSNAPGSGGSHRDSDRREYKESDPSHPSRKAVDGTGRHSPSATVRPKDDSVATQLRQLRESHSVPRVRLAQSNTLPAFTVFELATGGCLDSIAAVLSGFRHLGGTEDVSKPLG